MSISPRGITVTINKVSTSLLNSHLPGGDLLLLNHLDQQQHQQEQEQGKLTRPLPVTNINPPPAPSDPNKSPFLREHKSPRILTKQRGVTSPRKQNPESEEGNRLTTQGCYFGMDDVKLFPALLTPAPEEALKLRQIKHAQQQQKTAKRISKPKKEENEQLPGVLVSTKSKLSRGQPVFSPANTPATFVGFNASNIKMDNVQPMNKHIHQPPHSPTMTVVDMLSQVPHSASTTKRPQKQDPALEELRSYTTMMDEYSLHNFMIWNGKALRNTPEFLSYKRTYENQWTYISTTIAAIEKLMSENGIKLAIISGIKLAELSMLNLPYLSTADLLSCCANGDQIKPQLSSLSGEGKDSVVLAAIKIQSLARRWNAIHNYRKLKRRFEACVIIQAIIRRFVARCNAVKLVNLMNTQRDFRWRTNMEKLQTMWSNKPDRRLLIHIPSISAMEYIRLNLPNIKSIENSHISCLHQLIDPRVELIYVSPFPLKNSELAYFDRFLSLLGVSTFPRRLKFVVPEMATILPAQIPLGQVLWYSSSTLRKLKTIIADHHETILIPSDISWAEKRIANFLQIPMIAPDPVIVPELSSRSQSKRLFMESCVNVPIGAHDIYSEEDFLIAISRLMAANLDIKRWIIRLNADFNNESCAYIDSDKLAIINCLRLEQQSLISTIKDPKAWFEKTVQFNARKRILKDLKAQEMSCIHICRKDMFHDWGIYLGFLRRIGCVIEAEPPNIRGRIESYCFIDPSGELHISKGTHAVCDENYQVQSKVFPQAVVHDASLEGATKAIAYKLFNRFGVIGYITISFVSFYDSHDDIPRIWATGIHFGMDATFGALGTLATLLKSSDISNRVAHPLVPFIPEGRHCVFIPTAVHHPLASSRDDVFFKICAMNGIAFDAEHRTGVLFFLVDSIVGGTISCLIIADTRTKAMEYTIQMLTFLLKNFGKDTIGSGNLADWTNMRSILSSLKSLNRKENAITRGISRLMSM